MNQSFGPQVSGKHTPDLPKAPPGPGPSQSLRPSTFPGSAAAAEGWIPPWTPPPPADGKRVVLVGPGEVLVLTIPETVAVDAESANRLCDWFEKAGINVVVIHGQDVEIDTRPADDV